MRIAIFGGSFNPPHKGHIEAALAATRALEAERLLVIPAGTAPHKDEPRVSAPAAERMLLTELAFAGEPHAEVLGIELERGGKSYTVDTLETLKGHYPDDELWLLMGSDMLYSFESWKDYRRILELASLIAFPRERGEAERLRQAASELKEKYGAVVEIIPFVSTEISSSELRGLLQNREGRQYLDETVYEEIIKKRLYAAKPDLAWLRSKAYAMLDERRVPHVAGCEQEAVRLAERWGADTGEAAEAGILHDITKKLKGSEQLKLCDEYDIMTDDDERNNVKLLHSKTGAACARELFGVTDAVYNAIFWHTTGKENMTLLEKIVYLADYIEPTRSFDGVEPMRRLAYEDIDAALEMGLRMSLDELAARGVEPHVNTVKAAEYYKNYR